MAHRTVIFFLTSVFGVLVAGAPFAAFQFASAQFNGPPCGAGGCPGAIASDNANNISVGVNVPLATSRLYVVATGTASYFGLKVYKSGATGPILVARNDGRVGVNTSTPDAAEFTVQGSIYATGNITGAGSLGGVTLSANNITPGVFNGAVSTTTGDFAFPGKLGIGTSTFVNLPQTLSVYGGAQLGGDLRFDAGTNRVFGPFNSTGVNQTGANLSIFAGAATNGTAAGGSLALSAGGGHGSGAGGAVSIFGGVGPSGTGGSISMTGGSGTIGGNVTINPGSGSTIGNIFLANFWGNVGVGPLGGGAPQYTLDDAGSFHAAQTAIFDSSVGIGTIIPAQQLEITGSFKLPYTTSNAGIIYTTNTSTLASVRYIHSFGPGPNGYQSNFFAGELAGNLNASLTGGSNTGVGFQALDLITSGGHNTAVGESALGGLSSGDKNTGIGWLAGGGGTGSQNTSLGAVALWFNNTGSANVAIGYGAGSDPVGNGNNASVSGSNNVFIGFDSGQGVPSSTALTNAIAIGANALVNVNNAFILGGTGANAVNVGIGTPAPGAKLEVVSSLSNGVRLRKTSGVAGSVDLFPAIGDATSRTGTVLCQTVSAAAVCIGQWTSAGAASSCSTSVTNSRALCATFGD